MQVTALPMVILETDYGQITFVHNEEFPTETLDWTIFEVWLTFIFNQPVVFRSISFEVKPITYTLPIKTEVIGRNICV